MTIDKSLAFFDVNSLEYFANQNDCLSILPHLSFLKRILPLAPVLNSLYSYAVSHGHPIVFSTCCSGKVPVEDQIPEMLPIPALDSGVCWKEQNKGFSLFWVEKYLDAWPTAPFTERIKARFTMNQNFRRFVQAMNVEEWVVFGNGDSFDLYSVLLSLLNAGEKVIILSDVLVDKDSSHIKDQARALCEQMLEDSKQRGAVVFSLQEFCDRKGIVTDFLNFHNYSGNLLPLLEARREL